MTEKRRIGVLIGIAVFLRWSISYQPYSGEGKPPMYGDYEAQRHWQEVTFNLPTEYWYRNASNNDLQYWGLDYPPLTAYHSLFLGKIANFLNKSYVELYASRGYESDKHRIFMRLSVLVSDILIYVPALIFFFVNIEQGSWESKKYHHDAKSNIFGFSQWHVLLATALIYPGIILIDHGHFQYNCVSLGFFIFATSLIIIVDYHACASLFFVLSLNYKQMELYHALPFFFYILGVCRSRGPILTRLRIFTSVTLTVISSFLIIWTPFFQKWPSTIDVMIRLFPLNRGVFEDKVANVWCAVNVIVKLKNSYDHSQLAKICLLATTIAILPSCLDMFLKPLRKKFILCLINVSLGFYLFSFQVHEKSILLVAIPVLLYFHKDPLMCFWFLIISVFSMLPLLIQDQLFSAYCSLMIFYFVAVFWMWPNILQFTNTMTFQSKSINQIFQKSVIRLFGMSMFGVIILTLASRFIKSPAKYPDLFPLLVSIYSCGHFCLFFLYFNVKQLDLFGTNIYGKYKFNW